jgi:hypothetical protein
MGTGVLVHAYLRRACADVPRQRQGGGAETAQGKTENENPAHRPAARDSCRGCTMRTRWRPAGLP